MLVEKGGSILVPLDGSERADDALKVATDLAERYEAELVLVTVFGDREKGFLDEFALTEQVTILQAGDIYARGLATAGGDRVRHHEVIWADRPADDIVTYIESTKPDLVVISSHGRSGVSRWMLGSVAERILRASVAPVLVIPDPKRSTLPV